MDRLLRKLNLGLLRQVWLLLQLHLGLLRQLHLGLLLQLNLRLLSHHWADHILNDRGSYLRVLVLQDGLLDLLLLNLDLLRSLNHLLDLELLRLD